MNKGDEPKEKEIPKVKELWKHSHNLPSHQEDEVKGLMRHPSSPIRLTKILNV
jgi:hypothetical protein